MKLTIFSIGIATLLSGVNGFSAAEPTRAMLVGHLMAIDKSPITNATVLIFSAGPRAGGSGFCPTCYVDCGKQAKTDRQGDFQLGPLDPDLVFRIIIVAKNFQTRTLPQIDPLNGPLSVPLESQNLSQYGPKHLLQGRVVDPEGKQVLGAVISVNFSYGQDVNTSGAVEGVDMMAVSDPDGHFALTADKTIDWMDVVVEAPNLARKKFFRVPTGRMLQFRLTEGATVTGRLLQDNKPLANLAIGLNSVDATGRGAGRFDTKTDAQGRFQIDHVSPYQDYYLYRVMPLGSESQETKWKRVEVRGDGSRVDLGDVTVF
jgi:hypothetical protein